MGHVPAVVVAACRDRWQVGSAGGQHRGHHRVGGAEQVEQPGIGRAQRRAEHRQRPPAGVLDGPAQRLDVTGVAGEVLGAVVQHRDRRAVACQRAAPVEDAPARRGDCGGEAEAGHQHGVAEEARAAAARFGHAALGEIDMRPAALRLAGVVEWPIRSASGDCSPLTTTVGTPLADTRCRCRPARRGIRRGCARRRCRRPASSSSSSPSTSRDGFAHR